MKSLLTAIAIILFSVLLFNTVEAQKQKTDKAKVDPEFVQFWKDMKTALIKKDKNKIIEMSNFPLIIFNQYSGSTYSVKNSKEFDSKKLKEYSATAFEQLSSDDFINLIKKIKTLGKAFERYYNDNKEFIFLREFKLKKEAPLFVAEKDYCDLIISKVNGQVKLIGVMWSPADD